jgi:hypothetical protein
MGRRAAGFGCFCCFRTDLSAIDISSSAAFLGRRPFGDLKNSQNDGCSAAVLCGVSTLRRVCATIAGLASCHYREAVSAGLKIPYHLGYQNRKRL